MYYDYFLYYLSYLDSLYNGYPLIIRMTVVMVMLLAAIAVLGFIQLLFVGYRVKRRERKEKEAREYFEDRLSFVMKSKTVYELEEVKELLHYEGKKVKSWKADILTDIVLSVKDTVNKEEGVNEINYKNCLEVLSIMGFWENRIKKSGLSKRREALQVMGQIDNGVNVGTLSKSTFHKNKHLRKTARELYTEYDNYNPFRFMEDNFDESFTSLDKLRLHSTLIKRDKESKLPNLLRWVNSSKNTDYIIFIIKEISFFKQYETIPTLIMMLEKQENKEVRAQIVHTIGDLGSSEYVSYLIDRFALESTLVREAIITAIGKIKGNTSLSFLIKNYESSEDTNLKMLIARAIKNHGDEGIQALRTFKQNVNNKVSEGTLLEHVISEGSVLPA